MFIGDALFAAKAYVSFLARHLRQSLSSIHTINTAIQNLSLHLERPVPFSLDAMLSYYCSFMPQNVFLIHCFIYVSRLFAFPYLFSLLLHICKLVTFIPKLLIEMSKERIC